MDGSDLDEAFTLVNREQVAGVLGMSLEFDRIVEEEKNFSKGMRIMFAEYQRNQSDLMETLDHVDERGRHRTIRRQPELCDQSRAFWETKVVLLSNDRFQKKFRLSRDSFEMLVNKLRCAMTKQDTSFGKAIPVEKRVAIALYFLKTNIPASVVSDVFTVGLSTVHSILHDFCDAVNDLLFNEYVVFPYNVDAKKKIAEDFMTRWQFPNTFGSLDGTHIPIKAPYEFPEDYWNYKSFHSIVLMGLVDAKGKFIYTNIGRPGKANDASIFNDCSLKNLLTERSVVDSNLHIIGDGAFPLLTTLMKPYLINNKITDQQEHFNRRLSRARVVVEDAFGRLKGRFRILMKRADFDVETMVKVTKTCVVLHNICEERGERFWPTWDKAVEEHNKRYTQPSFTNDKKFDTTTAKGKRESLCDLLFGDDFQYEN